MVRICVDHDHVGAHVRGLLCDACNLALEFMRTPGIGQDLTNYMLANELFYSANQTK
jgi:hypothetical protein